MEIKVATPAEGAAPVTEERRKGAQLAALVDGAARLDAQLGHDLGDRYRRVLRGNRHALPVD